jgi:hypothetical protein
MSAIVSTATERDIAGERSAPNAGFEESLPAVVKWFIVATFLPEEASFYVGDLRMTVWRLFMVLSLPWFIYRFGKMANAVGYRFVWSDLFVPLIAVWIVFATSMVDGFVNTIKSSGINAMEVVVPYMLTRTVVIGKGQIVAFLRFLCIASGIIGFLAVLDAVAGRWVTRETFALFTGYTRPYQEVDFRFGLARAASTAEHPILLGTVCMAGVVLAWNLRFRSRLLCVLGGLVGLVLSVSSAPLGGLILATGLIAYERWLQFLKARWHFVVTILGIGFIALIALHPNPRGFLIGLIAFNGASAYYRLYLFDWVEPYILANPWFGIGLRDTVVAKSDLPSTLDSYWYCYALFFGFPCVAFTVLGMVGCCSTSLNARFDAGEVSEDTKKLGFVLTALVATLFYIATTVFFWGIALEVVYFIIGLRANLGSIPNEGPPKAEEGVAWEAIGSAEAAA